MKKDPEMSDDEFIMENVMLVVMNNLPSEKKNWRMEQVTCDLCESSHPDRAWCEFRVNNKKINDEAGNDITLGEINDCLKHKRAIIFGVVLKSTDFQLLKGSSEKIRSNSVAKAEVLTLDNCFKAFEREEFLSGSDQWYCPQCKEHRDILKKMEIYSLPKVLVL